MSYFFQVLLLSHHFYYNLISAEVTIDTTIFRQQMAWL